MFRYLTLAALLTAGATTAATAQSTQPTQPTQTTPQVETRLAPADTTNRVEGIYVAPGMTGAPKQQVMTDYDNNPLKKATPAKRKSSTLSADEPRKTTPARRP
ncbi:hypothetical protein [Hymenobacter aerophilus]|uniref:hypothetical protein n=1 Tax=Hymenobacter aerophilus TaxID=119644 RepID=UPI00037FCAE5|nr:hypothetical protein [Hymenobacter aerophilus]